MDTGVYNTRWNCSLQWLKHLIPLPAICESFSCFIALPIFSAITLFDWGHSNECEMLSHCSFPLHCLDTDNVKHLPVCLLPLYIICSLKHLFCCISIVLFTLFLSTLHILDTSSLSIQQIILPIHDSSTSFIVTYDEHI